MLYSKKCQTRYFIPVAKHLNNHTITDKTTIRKILTHTDL